MALYGELYWSLARTYVLLYISNVDQLVLPWLRLQRENGELQLIIKIFCISVYCLLYNKFYAKIEVNTYI